MAHWFKKLFAETGTKTTVPDAADPSGFISYDVGYGPDYERVLGTDPLAKTIERDKLNQVLYDITGAIQQYQTHGFYNYIDAIANGGIAYAYALNAIVLFTDGKNYVNTVAGNTNAPNVSGWIELGSVSTIIHNMTANADYTLSATENKYLRISITDTSVFLTTGRNIIVDNSQRRFLAVNNTLQILTLKTSAGTGISVGAGQSAELLCDGTNVIRLPSYGTITNDNAEAGQIGEYISSTVLAASALALTTATGLNITSISLTAGDWDVEGFIGFKGLATIGMLFSDFSTTSAIRSASPVSVPGFGAVFNEATYGPWLIPTTQKRISIAATTTIYLVAYANFSAGTLFSAYGTISARRVR